MNAHEERVLELNRTLGKIFPARIISYLRAFLLFFIVIGFSSAFIVPVNADDGHRVTTAEVIGSVAHWQLVSWDNGSTVCDLFVNHENQPTPDDVFQSCGQKILNDWMQTPPCTGIGAEYCTGLMLRLIGVSTQKTTEEVILPEITMKVETVNCTPGQVCSGRPELKVVAEEPVVGHHITRVHIRIGDNEKVFEGAQGRFRLPITQDNGGWITYWAESSLGDESQRFQVKFRSVKVGEAETPVFRLDLLSDPWAETLPAGSAMWEIFPSSEYPLPRIYDQPIAKEYLATANQYNYLAAHLIRKGLADARSCGDGGLIRGGGASPCGEAAAAARVVEWQNKYDEQIFNAAIKYTVPARLLKGMIAQESQFWPVSDNPYEQGLGYITEDGVSMLLQWNQQYYLSVCLSVFDPTICWGGYSNLREDRQAMLRSVVFGRVGTTDEVDLLGAMLYASALQTEQLVTNVMRLDLSDATTYEDMWKMSIANYYAGSGCLGETLRSAASDELPITWDGLSNHLAGICIIADNYVRRVFEYSELRAILSFPKNYLGYVTANLYIK